MSHFEVTEKCSVGMLALLTEMETAETPDQARPPDVEDGQTSEDARLKEGPDRTHLVVEVAREDHATKVSGQL